MSLFEKLQTVFLLIAIVAGLSLGRVPVIATYADTVIVPSLMLMLFGLFLTIPLGELRNGFGNIKFALASLGINFLWVPVLGWVIGSFFLADHPALFIGYIMLLVTPCTDWYVIFTSIARGNVALSLSILPLNLVLQVLLLPVYLVIFTGISGGMDAGVLLESVILVLVFPLVLALISKRLFSPERGFGRFLRVTFPKMQFLFLCLAIVAMFASQGAAIIQNPDIFLVLLLPVLLFFVINFIVGRVVANFMKFSREDSISLSLTTLARNSPVSLAIAVTAFPHEPLVALALVIGPLIELPVLALISQVLLHARGKKACHQADR